jgi:hypothetical protein
MCDKHYTRFRRNGTLKRKPGTKGNPRGPGICEVEGCGGDRLPYRTNGALAYSPLCYVHYEKRKFERFLKRQGYEVEIKLRRMK